MARPLRIELAGGLYHVMAHGNGRLWLFHNDTNRIQLLNIIGSATSKYRAIIHAFVLMTTHVHLLVETPLANLSQFMRKCLSDYGSYYNRRFRRHGSVFKSRYGSCLIQKDTYYKAVVRYLYSNPVQAGIVKRPEQYRWSSLYYLLNQPRRREVGWFKVAEVLHLAGGRQSLVELLEEEGDELPRVYHTFIGDKDWADGIIKEYGGKLDEEISAEWEMRRGVCDVDKVIRLVAREYGLTKNELLGNRISNARKVCVYLLSKYTPLDADAIGELLGMSKWAVFKTVHRLVGCTKEMKIVGKLKRQLS